MKNLRNEFVLAAIPKDVKKGGAVCKNDSGSGLILKRGNRFVQIGMFFKLTKHYMGHKYMYIFRVKVLFLERKCSPETTNGRQIYASRKTRSQTFFQMLGHTQKIFGKL